MLEIATPVSHLFDDIVNATLVLENSDCLEGRDHAVNFELDKQRLFHCDLQPIHAMVEDDFRYLEMIKKERKSLELVSFHLATCYKDPVIKNGIFTTGTQKYSRNEMLEFSRVNFKRIKSIMGPKIAIAVENNNYYPTPAYDEVCNPTFISEIVIQNDIFLLFDIAHAKISAHNLQTTYKDYCLALPLMKCIQIHICKSNIIDDIAVDSHDLPDINEYEELIRIHSVSKYLKFITIEYYKDLKLLLKVLQDLKKMLNDIK